MVKDLRQKKQQETTCGCSQLTGESGKRGPWGQSGGKPGVRGCCPVLPWLQALWGPLEFRTSLPVGGGEGEGKAPGWSGAPGREMVLTRTLGVEPSRVGTEFRGWVGEGKERHISVLGAKI